MAQHRYHVQLSVFEGGMLIAGFVLASVLIFVVGMYIGKEVQAQKIAQQTEPLRVPAVLSKNQVLSRPPATLSPPAVQMTTPAISDVLPEKRRPSAPQENVNRKIPELPKQFPQKIVTELPKRQAKLPTPPSLPSRQKAAPSAEQQIKKPSVAAATVSGAPISPKPPQAPPKKQDARLTRWSVQVQATSKEQAALQSAQQLRKLGYTPMLSKIHRQGQVLYRVRVGPFITEGDARAAIARFRREKTFAQAYLVSQ